MKVRPSTLASWSLQLLAAAILTQTLFFKFTGAEESRYIFSTLGLEPAGRYASGAAELIAAILLVLPRTAVIGAALTIPIMCGAIASHLTRLGIVVMDDGGLLFTLALVVLACAIGVVSIRREQLFALIHSIARLAPRRSSANSQVVLEPPHESR